MIKKIFTVFSAWFATSSALLFGKSGSNNDIVFGNYSDYISPSVAQELKNKYQLRVDLFDYDHLVKERFEKGIYDIAITSTSVLSELKSSKVAMKLDWSKLLKKEVMETGTINSVNELKTVEDAKKLFTEIVQDMSQDLLEYGIPYFIQKLGFYYRGKEIEELKEEKQVNFKKLIEIVSKEPRFHIKNGQPQLGLIDDPRTILSFARKVGGKEDVNPSEGEYTNSSDILSDYKKLINAGLNKDNLGNKFLFMTPDSGPLVDALSSGEIQGAFMYNGDGLFAANGGNAQSKIKGEDFHYVNLSENIFFLDFLTFSANMPDRKKEKAYALARELLFLKDDANEDPFREKSSEEDVVDAEDTVCSIEQDESEENETEYEEMAVRNFNEVQYTPTLKKLYDNLKKYFGYENPEKENCKELIKESTKHEIIKVEKPKVGKLTNDYEKQLNPQQKSDMLIAYSNFKLFL